MQNITTFTVTDIEKLRIKRERLQDWMVRGFIEPSIQKAFGQGTKNLFNIYDLYKIQIFKNLVEGYLRRSPSSKLVNSIAPNHFRGADFVAVMRYDNDKIVIKKISKNHNLDTDDNFDDIFLFNIEKIKKEVNEKIL